MAIYRLDCERKFGQLQLRLYPQGSAAPDFGPGHASMNALIETLDALLAPLEMPKNDQVIFRQIAYDTKVAVRETVRLSRF